MESSNYPKVHVYRNLTKNCWSIKSAKTGIVIFHAESLTLENVTPHVNEAGRQRVIASGRKEVHAWLTGDLVSASLSNAAGGTRNWFSNYDKENELMGVTCERFDVEYARRIRLARQNFSVGYNPTRSSSFWIHPNVAGTRDISTFWSGIQSAKCAVFDMIKKGETPKIYAVFE